MTRDQLIETIARAINQDIWRSCHDDVPLIDQARDDVTRRATAALTAIEEAGMLVVPVEPTVKMRRAGWHKLREKNEFQFRLGNSLAGVEAPVYEAMVLAAQEDSTSE